MASRKKKFQTKKERARRTKGSQRAASSRASNRFPNYEPNVFYTPKNVAKDLRRYAKWQLKFARSAEAHVQRLLSGTQDPRYAGRPPEPWETRRHHPDSRLVLKYRREAKKHRENARRALERARYWESQPSVKRDVTRNTRSSRSYAPSRMRRRPR